MIYLLIAALMPLVAIPATYIYLPAGIALLALQIFFLIYGIVTER